MAVGGRGWAGRSQSKEAGACVCWWHNFTALKRKYKKRKDCWVLLIYIGWRWCERPQRQHARPMQPGTAVESLCLSASIYSNLGGEREREREVHEPLSLHIAAQIPHSGKTIQTGPPACRFICSHLLAAGLLVCSDFATTTRAWCAFKGGTVSMTAKAQKPPSGHTPPCGLSAWLVTEMSLPSTRSPLGVDRPESLQIKQNTMVETKTAMPPRQRQEMSSLPTRPTPTETNPKLFFFFFEADAPLSRKLSLHSPVCSGTRPTQPQRS